ncbi:maleylacetoacetate isomerase [Paraburkholderia sp. BL25I1N1]|uniref:maleylacetoacetate isomerase n=1 Tax=Paraburkholderia sp. BL25I1N1 TaxID=1938804 RepID=UPI000D059312|nr:maleylacetoacetate isomerase [Paraburkholderia sp. BL25I1N1]PRX96384.1 maleylacetoacetate isomerase [Paraburkholderia sp. BL25I1N1]
MQLHSFFNSSTSYRIRIALALKRVPFDYVPVNIRTGEHRKGTYLDAVNPSATVPALTDCDFSLGQSLAIVDWLDARYPEPQLIPAESEHRARVLELSYLISCDIHPLNNLRVLKYLDTVLKVTPEQKSEWYKYWVTEGMSGVERLLSKYGSRPWCFGEQPTLADCCLVPQIANALRMGCNLDAYPLSMAVYRHASSHPAFDAAQPALQPDFVSP